LNRGRHLYSAGQSSRWALAHISSILYQLQVLKGNYGQHRRFVLLQVRCHLRCQNTWNKLELKMF